MRVKNRERKRKSDEKGKEKQSETEKQMYKKKAITAINKQTGEEGTILQNEPKENYRPTKRRPERNRGK